MIQEQTYSEVIERMNRFQKEGKEFLFMFNYHKTLGLCIPISEINDDQIEFALHEKLDSAIIPNFKFESFPLDFEKYNQYFSILQNEIANGNTYLCNLTFSTPIKCAHTIAEMYKYVKAKYKLLVQNKFLVFSPETFIRIKGNCISTNPMKGTINADLKDAAHKLLNDPKEFAEHNTIVDLLRNDLSIVSDNVTVNRFQYLDKVKTHNGCLLQMSSEIFGTIKPKYRQEYGTVLDLITPAGSVTGAPKRKTLEIIQNVESHHRNYYTGIFGIWQNDQLDSAVMIRFIELTENGLVFKSGGGIHSLSNVYKEYEELKSKIYVPIY